MRRLTFEYLLSKIHAVLDKPHLGRPSISTDKQLLSVLWLLATPDSYRYCIQTIKIYDCFVMDSYIIYRSVAYRFNLSKSSLSECLFKITKAINTLSKQIIHWPQEQDMPITCTKFKGIVGIDNIIGAIDGTFIPIKAPQLHPEVFRTRKSNYAMTLQAICDSTLKFLDCFIAYPGTVSDTRIFRNSSIYKNILADPRKYFPNPEMFIIRNKAYPLMDWCIPPYINRGNLDQDKVNFNIKISRTR